MTQRREFLKMAGAGLAGFGLNGALPAAVAEMADTRSTKNTADLVWAIAQKPNDIDRQPNTGKNSVFDVEKDLRAHGAGKDFRFGGVRMYLQGDDQDIHHGDGPQKSEFSADHRVFTPKVQGRNGHLYIPVITMRGTTHSPENLVRYPQVWAGKNDANWKAQFDAFEKWWGTKEHPVDGPKGRGAYPIVISFMHEFTLTREAGKCYDPSHPLAEPYQYAKAFRYLVDLQRAYKPGLNVRWTWIPMTYFLLNHGREALLNWWPKRVGADDSAPDVTNVDYIDIVGCDGYLDKCSFVDEYDPGGPGNDRSMVGLARSVGPVVNGKPTGLPWLIAEWGIHEWEGHPTWKSETLDDLVKQLPRYRDLVLMSLWSNAGAGKDNRYNSTPITAHGFGTPDTNGLNGQAFVRACRVAPHLGGRPNVFEVQRGRA